MSMSDFRPSPAWRAAGLRLLVAVMALFALAIIALVLGVIILKLLTRFSWATGQIRPPS